MATYRNTFKAPHLQIFDDLTSDIPGMPFYCYLPYDVSEDVDQTRRQIYK